MDRFILDDFEKLRIPDEDVCVAVRLLTYNVVEYVDRAVLSVLAQKKVKYALIVFDDCSTDGTFEKLLEYERNFPETVFVSRPKENSFQQGKPELSVALLEHIRCSYLAFLDGDDYWNCSGKLEKSIVAFQDPMVSATYHSILVADSSNGSIARVWSNWHNLMISNSVPRLLKRLLILSIPTNSLVVRNEQFPYMHSREIFRLKNPDLLLKFNATLRGRLVFIPERMAVLQVRRDSLWGPLSPAKKFIESLRAGCVAAELWGIRAFFEIAKYTFSWSIFSLLAIFLRRYSIAASD